jgi:hypothetical protein
MTKEPGCKGSHGEFVPSGEHAQEQDDFVVQLGEITPETTDDEFQSRFNAAVARYDTPAPPVIEPPV